ncbi:DUF3307 domain-containing protein [Pontiellaceae bacterium B1224]|nr:DUF3307 domain-containing protein [Pontiellaceae bacterium B1224]
MKEAIIVLISAHFITDFMLQPDWLQQRKGKLWANLIHAEFVALLGYLLLQQWTAWMPVLLIFAFHSGIDAVKQRCNDTSRSFCVDQSFHLVSILFVVWICRKLGWMADFTGKGLTWMILIAGFAVCVPGAGFLIGKVAEKLQEENNLAEKINGLKNGGKLIGQLERALIFLLIMIGQPGGIGFLVAAKSILRFGEAKDDQKLAEYVLIGTLLSFGLAIAAATITRSLLEGMRR